MIALQRLRPVGEACTAVFLFGHIGGLYQGADRTIQKNDPLADQTIQRLDPSRYRAHGGGGAATRPSASQMAAVKGARFMV